MLKNFIGTIITILIFHHLTYRAVSALPRAYADEDVETDSELEDSNSAVGFEYEGADDEDGEGRTFGHVKKWFYRPAKAASNVVHMIAHALDPSPLVAYAVNHGDIHSTLVGNGGYVYVDQSYKPYKG